MENVVNEAIAAVEEALIASGAVPEAMEAFAFEKSLVLHAQEASNIRRVKKSKFEGFDCVECGDYYEIMPKGIVINKHGELALAFKDWHLKDKILLSGFPHQIVLKYPKKTPQNQNVTILGLQTQLMECFRKAINEAPEPIKVAFREAYLKAIEEYEKGLGVSNHPGQMDVDEATHDPSVKDIDLLAETFEQINFHSYYRKGVRNQTSQVDTLHATVPSFKGPYDDTERMRVLILKKAENLIRADQSKVKKIMALINRKHSGLVYNHPLPLGVNLRTGKYDPLPLGDKETPPKFYRRDALSRILKTIKQRVIKAQQIRAKCIRTFYGVADSRNQIGQVVAHDVNYASVLSLSFKE